MKIQLHEITVRELVAGYEYDGVDRVIYGVHFGKKWKHHVRNAQQQLRRQGRIMRLADGRWALTDPGRSD